MNVHSRAAQTLPPCRGVSWRPLQAGHGEAWPRLGPGAALTESWLGRAWLCSVTCLSFQGLPYKHLITHHQEPRHRYLISTYDDHYNRHNYNPGLPPLRTWSAQKLLWLPEKADFPLLGT